MFVLTGNWPGLEDNVRIAVDADSAHDALLRVRFLYPKFHLVECFELFDVIY